MSLLLGLVATSAKAEPVKSAQGSLFAPSAFRSLGALHVGADQEITFDTGSADRAPAMSGVREGQGVRGLSASGQVELAVFAFDSIHLAEGATVKVSGDRGLVLVSRGAVEMNTTLDLSGQDGPNRGADNSHPGTPGGPGGEGGERGKSMASAPPPERRGNGGPGMKDTGRPGVGFGAGYNQRVKGGTAGGGGAYGGTGGAASEGSGGAGGPPRRMPGGEAYGNPSLADLFGGSGGAGGSNDRNFASAPGGGGGGALAILSATTITLGPKAGLHARGGNGGMNRVCGGGGSGGAVLLGTPRFIIHPGAQIDVRGGDGGSSEGTAEEIASGNHRRNRGSGGGGGGGRVAIYSQIDIGGPGKNKVETNIPAAILLSGGKGGEAALDGATGTLYDGTWPGLR